MAGCTLCEDTGMVWVDACTCGSGREFPHERYCGAEPCPNGCPVRPRPVFRMLSPHDLIMAFP